MGYFRLNFYMTEVAYNLGIVAYSVDLGRTRRIHAVAYAKAAMSGSSYYCYDVVEYSK